MVITQGSDSCDVGSSPASAFCFHCVLFTKMSARLKQKMKSKKIEPEKEPEESEGFRMMKANKNMMEKIAELGLEGKEIELPPDEVDYKDVEKSAEYSLMSFLPYTQAWYEAKAAEEALDGLKMIRQEISEANDLVAMTRMGRHEEALSTMMKETNNDYHYFNKLKNAEIEKGRFKYRPRNLDPFKDASQGKNRLIKAYKLHFDTITDSSLLKQINVQTRASKKKDTGPASKKCPWRGKAKDGTELQCNNDRFVHPTRKIKDRFLKERAVSFPECCYHLPKCSGEHIGIPPDIKVPNAEGLCTQCYFTKFKRKVPLSKAEFVPGVCPFQEPIDPLELQKDEDEMPLCKWRASGAEALTEKRGYLCRNHVMRHPQTHVLLATCGMHVGYCIRPHADNNGFIEIANIFGLCTRHHVVEHGQLPIPLKFPYPGMKRKMRDKGWAFKPDHWAAPTWFPLPDAPPARVYYAPLAAVTRWQRFWAWYKNYRYE
eukprot:gene11107-23210_t